MAENDRLSRAPILIEDLRAVARGDRGHALPPLVRALTPMRPRSQRNESLVVRSGRPAHIRRDGTTELAARAVYAASSGAPLRYGLDGHEEPDQPRQCARFR